jgi:hypothetical protein
MGVYGMLHPHLHKQITRAHEPDASEQHTIDIQQRIRLRRRDAVEKGWDGHLSEIDA